MTLRSQIREMKESRNTGVIIPLIDQYLYRRPPDDRTDGWHVSEVCMMCARARVLARHESAIVGSNAAMERVYDIGKGVHHIYQNWYAGNAGVLWGQWECQRCSEVRWGTLPKGDAKLDVCAHDGDSHVWKYLEIPLCVSAKKRLQGYRWASEGVRAGMEYKGLVGSSDGLVYSKAKKQWICWDIKSCKTEVFQFQLHAGPLEHHLKQVNMYAYLISNGYASCPPNIEVPPISSVCVFYVNKNTSEEKEFLFPINKEWVHIALNELVKYDRFCTVDMMPTKHPECLVRGSAREKKCPWKSQCSFLG